MWPYVTPYEIITCISVKPESWPSLKTIGTTNYASDRLPVRLSWFQDFLEIGKDSIANYENKVYHRQYVLG